jgi:mannose-6-phosphate isomerase-like protein (cupin superfamily)
MIDGKTIDGRKSGWRRRDALVAGAATCIAAWSVAGIAAIAASPADRTFSLEREADVKYKKASLHGGKKSVDLHRFDFSGAPRPARFIVYNLPPGASEGVHVHYLDNRNGEGAFDEYYYIVSGEGVMEIDGEAVNVHAGDHVHTPLDVAHGIENTHPSEMLRVYLTFTGRGDFA